VPRPGAHQVLIAVAAAGVNRADLLQARGAYPPPPGAPQTPGLEVSGQVTAIGAGVTRFVIGDRVCALISGGGYAGYALASECCTLPVPGALDLVDAAAFPEALFTAWTNLFDAARLQPGERVLVHGGTSGIGVAAIQILAQLGHEIFTTAGSDAKVEICRTLGARRAINYRNEDFVAAIAAETGGAGVDVILDMVGGDYIQRNIAAAAVWGRIVNIAYQSGARVLVDFTPLLVKRLSLMATTLRGRSDAQKGAIRDALAARVWPLVEKGAIRPVVAARFALADAQKAHETMAKGGHTGKILLVCG
jgi:putative PIG3 family NAD(P)H quinone oxidoreductase